MEYPFEILPLGMIRVVGQRNDGTCFVIGDTDDFAKAHQLAVEAIFEKHCSSVLTYANGKIDTTLPTDGLPIRHPKLLERRFTPEPWTDMNYTSIPFNLPADLS
jgi:hypothetical protein